jgi:hypothetical protein
VPQHVHKLRLPCPAGTSNPILPPGTPVTVTSPSGQVLGIDPQTGLLGFVSPNTTGGGGSDGSGASFVLINPLDPSSPVEPGDPVVLLSSTGKYCAFSTSQPLSCSTSSTSGMVCNLDSPTAASTLTYR